VESFVIFLVFIQLSNCSSPCFKASYLQPSPYSSCFLRYFYLVDIATILASSHPLNGTLCKNRAKICIWCSLFFVYATYNIIILLKRTIYPLSICESRYIKNWWRHIIWEYNLTIEPRSWHFTRKRRFSQWFKEYELGLYHGLSSCNKRSIL
jgi:hypothetical protein